MLGLAKRCGAKLLLASTSEIYGNPAVHPQPETYFGNVNTMGPRSCYDEGKRIAETMCYSYMRQVRKIRDAVYLGFLESNVYLSDQDGVQVRIARIFNTFGPRMHIGDGRVVSNFIVQALQGKALTIYGDGMQTRLVLRD
jgi:UDP-glucuronate decarboxylase